MLTDMWDRTRKVKYLEENFGALDVELTDEEVNAIRKAVESAEVHGERVPEMFRIGMFADSPLP